MRKLCRFLAMAAMLTATPAFAKPSNCLKNNNIGRHVVAGHRTVMTASGGCSTNAVYQRHEKSLKEKAALWDREHISEPGGHKSWWQGNMSKEAIIQKAQWYDAEHPVSDKGKMLEK